MELSDFLVEAKRNAYIGEESVYKILEDGCKEYVFQKDNLAYRDRYFGFGFFSGEEVVFWDKKPYWAMNYCGELLDKHPSARETYDFLGEVLAEVSGKVPFRGPKFFSRGKFVYLNHIEGKIDKFIGEEFILFDGKKVYELYYHGGFIKE